MKPQRWWTTRRHGFSARLFKEREREVSSVAFGNHRKTGRLQRAAVLPRFHYGA